MTLEQYLEKHELMEFKLEAIEVMGYVSRKAKCSPLNVRYLMATYEISETSVRAIKDYHKLIK